MNAASVHGCGAELVMMSSSVGRYLLLPCDIDEFSDMASGEAMLRGLDVIVAVVVVP
jgi:hypothetical protein